MRIQIPDFDLALTAASGQSFRFHRIAEGEYQLVARAKVLTIKDLGADLFEFSCNQEDFDAIWSRYFDLGRDYAALFDMLPEQDGYLKQACQYAKGVRILQQEPFETLMAFIISQRKSIPAIKGCMAQLARRFGVPIDEAFHAFPSPNALAEADPAELAACGLGYRTNYIKRSAQMVAEGQVDLESLRSLNDQDLEEALMRFPGVGKKVAACVMLFAYQRMDAFPVDVWIQKVFETEFLEGFPYDRFPGVAGIIQQYLFCYARHLAGRA